MTIFVTALFATVISDPYDVESSRFFVYNLPLKRESQSIYVDTVELVPEYLYLGLLVL